ncbi:MAG: hypothetical protein WC365_09310 [Candidatus Babeliales bacterium]|jgi:hypothetical protein
MFAILANGIELKGSQAQQFFKRLQFQDQADTARNLTKLADKDTPLKLRYYRMRNGKIVDAIYGE